MKKKFYLMLAMIIMGISATTYASFSDLADNHWAKGYIIKLSEKGVINGYEDGTFKPNDKLTKGQFIKLIMSASLPKVDFSKAQKDFSHWAAGYVKAAENYGVLEKGTITLANIDEPITRIDMVEILSLSDVAVRKTPQFTQLYLDDFFTDVDGLTERQKYMLIHAVANDFINGYEDSTFRPNNYLTRAEASKIIAVYMGF